MFIMRMLEFDATVSVYRRKRERKGEQEGEEENGSSILSNGLSQILMLNAISCIYSYILTRPEIQLKPTVSLLLLPNQSTIAPCEAIHLRNDPELIQHCM